MAHLKRPIPSALSGLLLSLVAGVHAESAPESAPSVTVRVENLERQVAQQQTLIDELRRMASWNTLSAQRGAGKPADGTVVAQASPPKPVGQAPATEGRPPEVAPLFEQPGVLTQPGQFVLEPSLQYGYSSSNRIALVGYTVIPAILIGLIDVREIKRNTMIAALAGRAGVTKRLEVELKVPFVYRSDDNVSREIGIPGTGDQVFSATGSSVGDVELGARYQLNSGGIDTPFFIGGVRYKTRTGKDPFEVVTECNQRCVSIADGSGLPLELPTGSGFTSLQLGLTMLYPSDPAVFFGTLSYTHSFPRDNISRTVLNGQQEFLGSIAPGAVVGVNFGMGLALNEKSSFSIGYDHSAVGKTRQNGVVVPGSVVTQLGTLLLGYSYRLNPSTTLNLSVGAGITRDTPDVSITLRMPVTF